MRLPIAIALAVSFIAAGPSLAVGTSLSFQGTLEDAGQPANGLYDLQFQVKTTGGTNVGPLLTLEDQQVTNGVFTVQLDFGAGVFTGSDRRIALFVRAGSSAGGYTQLLPDLPVSVAPYAQVAATAEIADIAYDTTDYAIDEIDIETGAVSARTIGASAVGTSELAADAVTSAKIDDGSIVAADIASNTLTLSKFQGVSGNYGIAATVAANDCNDYDVTFGGDVVAGDAVFLNIHPDFQLPDSMSITALRVYADNQVELRICNEASVQQSTGAITVRLTTLR